MVSLLLFSKSDRLIISLTVSVMDPTESRIGLITAGSLDFRLPTFATSAAVDRGWFVSTNSRGMVGKLMGVIEGAAGAGLRWKRTAFPFVATVLSIPLGLP